MVVSSNHQATKKASMKISKADIHGSFHKIPEIRFEDQRLTSFGGLVIIQALLARLHLKRRLRRCFSHIRVSNIFGHHVVTLWLIVHLLLGFRRLRDRDYYDDDPMVRRVLGLRSLPHVSTISRYLKSADAKSVDKLQDLLRELTLDRLTQEALSRVTLDFDGSVLSTQGHLEGSAVGFNKKKKGARSYYPLFCTVAQTQQFLDRLHRPGNVHDSKGAGQFMLDCVARVRSTLPGVTLEARMDSAFFDQKILLALDDDRVEFSASVPFERLAELKEIIESRRRWRRIDERWSYFETSWKPKSWPRGLRFLFFRQRVAVQEKGPIQLDLFIPKSYRYEYKVVVTNKECAVKTVLHFHNGRGSQEGMFAEAKSAAQLDYLPVRSLCGNQLYSLAALFAHNLGKQLQMQTYARERGTTEKRSPLWRFESLRGLRLRVIQRAGRVTEPHGALTLTMNANRALRDEIHRLLDAQRAA
jgi:hypothetical protein